MFDKPTRNHFSIIFERLGAVFIIILIYGWNALEDNIQAVFKKEFWQSLPELIADAESRIILIAAAVFVLVSIFVLTFSVLMWRKTFFYIEGDNLIYEKRTLFRRSSKLPIKNIATINLERNIFERIVGTAKVKVDLNSAATADKTDFVFILREPLARQFQDLLTARRNALLANNSVLSPTAQDKAREVISFSPSGVIRHTLVSLPVMQGILVFVFGVLLPSLGTEEISLGDTVPVAVIMLAGGLLSAAVGTLNLLGYTVKADNDNIYISHGKLKKTGYSFNKSRINAVFLRQPFAARLFGLYAVEVAVVGMGNEKNEKPMLTLLVKKDELNRIFSECIPDYACGGETLRQSGCALAKPLILSVLSALAIIPAALLSEDMLWIIPAVLSAVIPVCGLLSWRTKTLAADSDVFHYSQGILSKRTLMFKYSDIQNVSVTDGPISRRFGAGKMTVSILSSSANKTHRTGIFREDSLFLIAKNMVERRDSSAELWG